MGAVGLGWRPELADVLLDDERIAFTEVIAENICCHLPDDLAHLRALDVPVVTHGVTLSIASPDALDDHTTAVHLRDVARMLDSPVVSEHIAFTRAGRRPNSPHGGLLHSGHLLAPPLTKRSARVVAANARVVADIVERPFVLENIASTMDFAESTWTEADYFDHLASISDVGFILDVSNVLAAASLHGTDPATVIARYPLERVAYLHIGGGVYGSDRLYRDTHTHTVHADAWTLLRVALGNPRLRHTNVMLEWDGNFHQDRVLDEVATLSATVGDDVAVFPGRVAPLNMPVRGLPRRGITAYANRLNTTLRCLLHGDLPRDFGTVGARATTDTLWGKRFFEAACADPTIREVPDVRTRFDDYARDHPHRISAAEDARWFRSGADHGVRLTGPARRDDPAQASTEVGGPG
ncbi:DUF692 domain-containing protein [Williamsia sterculiae]|uniref:Uncharacterized conserved protein, UPF0276 family n=1 Tax=Williamsia sterculiae TaxID=1344003 RepID=A0A1N7EQL4_9NOCA|nr:DUF692 family multinuclear iron-containing protein [Williamsia sterculiae]SIR90381.1 Uncharacterized conserved protein, UPF0276 family [Williamsia sterculiae]